MRTKVPEKILALVDIIQNTGNASVTRLTVLKKWFEHPGRLQAFGLWIARRAAGESEKTGGEFGKLLTEASALLGNASGPENDFSGVAGERELEDFYRRAKEAQSTYKNIPFGVLRIVDCWPLLLVEKGIALYLKIDDAPTAGYALAADWAKNYDPRCGEGLNGPSIGKLNELVRFIYSIEALEPNLPVEEKPKKKKTPTIRKVHGIWVYER